MLRTHKRIGLVAALAVVPLALTACGGAGGGSDDDGTSGATTLKLWHYEGADSAMAKAWDKAIDIFEDEHYQAREMLVKHQDPEFGEYVGPGIVPKFSETPGEVRWSATWDEGSHNRDVYGGLLGLSDDECAELKEQGVL